MEMITKVLWGKVPTNINNLCCIKDVWGALSKSTCVRKLHRATFHTTNDIHALATFLEQPNCPLQELTQYEFPQQYILVLIVIQRANTKQRYSRNLVSDYKQYTEDEEGEAKCKEIFTEAIKRLGKAFAITTAPLTTLTSYGSPHLEITEGISSCLLNIVFTLISFKYVLCYRAQTALLDPSLQRDSGKQMLVGSLTCSILQILPLMLWTVYDHVIPFTLYQY